MAVNACPHCGQRLIVPETTAGQMLRCPKCQSAFVAAAVPPPSAPAASATTLASVIDHCSGCHKRVQRPEYLKGQKIRCPLCATVFLAGVPSTGITPASTASVAPNAGNASTSAPARGALQEPASNASPAPFLNLQVDDEPAPAREILEAEPVEEVPWVQPIAEDDRSGPIPVPKHAESRRPMPVRSVPWLLIAGGLGGAAALLVLVLLGVRAMKEKGNLEWQEVVSAEGRYRVLMPGKPVADDSGQGGAVTHKNVVTLRKQDFVVGYGDFPADGTRPRIRLETCKQGILEKLPGAKLLQEKSLALDGEHAGNQFVFEVSGKAIVVVRAYVVRNRFYMISSGGTRFKPDDKDLQTFLDSFALYDPAPRPPPEPEAKSIEERLELLRQGQFTKPPPSAAETAYFKVVSSSGEAIGGGQTYLLKGDHLRADRYRDSIAIAVEDWHGRFAGNNAEVPTIGEYHNARGYPFHGGAPGISVSRKDRWGKKATGDFVVWEVEFEGNRVTRLALDFIHRDGAGPPLYGMIRIGSTFE